ncbi:MAG: hypothetical protein PHV37_00535 [Candidatus Gastranaerophilales bacterium]|nr:hypothetical protein [Candidatus Gastranaerophilales bacterium]
MKRFLLILSVLLLTTLSSMADIVPVYTTSIAHYGIGVLNMPDSFSIYEEPYETSRILKTVNYELVQNSNIIVDSMGIEDTLIVYAPMKKIALVAVDSNTENGWFEIFYDQKSGATGWVRQNDLSNFKPWKDVFNSWGKANGIYMFRDVTDEKKRMYSSDDTASQILEQVIKPNGMNFTVIRGNWMLARTVDVGKTNKIGWMRWREDDGTLLMFPRF